MYSHIIKPKLFFHFKKKEKLHFVERETGGHDVSDY